MSPDPFDVLRDELVAAQRRLVARGAASPPRTRRRGRRPLIVAIAALTLCGSATAAVLTLTGGTPSAPLRGSYPAQPGEAARNYTIALAPNLFPGEAGWCTRVAVRTGRRPLLGSMGCGPAPAAGAPLVAGGGIGGPGRTLTYAVVDRRVAAVEVAPGVRVTPRAEASLPFGWRAVVAFVHPRGELPTSDARPRLFDAHGQAISQGADALAGTRAAGTRRLATRSVDPLAPPPVPCAITHSPIPHLRHVSQTIVAGRLTHRVNVSGRALRTCSEAAFSLGRPRLRAAVLIDAAGPERTATALPGARPVPGHPGVVDTPALLTGRRVGRAWLVVDGGTLRLRLRLLAALRFRPPTR